MTHPPSSAVAVLIPVKDLVNAKQRLAPVLSAEERLGFFSAMLEDVLSAVCEVRTPREVFIVTRDQRAGNLAADYGAQVLTEPANRGHTEAVKFGAQMLEERGIGCMLTMPADVPLARAEEIEAVINAHRSGPSITIAPAHDEMGSNAIMCTPPGALDFRFGDNSFYPHLAQARSAGIEPTVVPQPGIGLDIDRPEDLALFLGRASDTCSYRYAQRRGIVKRLFS